MGLENLPDVHARGHTQGIEHDLDGSSVRQVRHVLLGEDAADDALVPVTTGHLVADLELALHGHEDLDRLVDAGRQLVALGEKRHAVGADLLDDVDLRVGALQDEPHLVTDLLVLQLEPLEHPGRHLADFLDRQLAALLHQDVALRVGHVLENGAPREKGLDFLLRLGADDPDLVVGVLREAADLLVENLLGPDVLLLFLVFAGEDLHLDDDALDSRGALERGVAHVAGLLAEDRAKELLFGRELRLALRRDLAHENVAGLDVRPDAHDAGLVEVAKRVLRDVRDVLRDLLGTELRLAGLDLELLDVDGGVVVLLDHLLGDEDRVLVVVAAPRHEGDEDVAAERELALR